MKESDILDHGQLLINLKKSIELWFLSRRDEQISTELYHDTEDLALSSIQIQLAIKSILTDGLKPESAGNSYQQLANDLNWLHASTQLQLQITTSAATTQDGTDLTTNNDFLSLWLYESIRFENLCSSLQLLATDKELLENYYTSNAFVRNDKFSTALFICISAFELKQSSLLSQIDESLYHLQVPETRQHHKRSSSHPNFSISPKTTTKTNLVPVNQLADSSKPIQKCLKMCESLQLNRPLSNYNMFKRKWKSLPHIHMNYINNESRPRSKTFSQPISIPSQITSCMKTGLITIDDKPSIMISKAPDFVYQSCHSGASTSSGGNNNIASTSKTPDFYNSVKQCINCDDIKIHLDMNFQNFNTPQNLTPDGNERRNSTDYYNNMTPKSSLKGLSPTNFLSCISANIFSPLSKSPIPATVWSTPINDNSNSPSFSSSLHNDVFGSFMTTRDGEKLKKTNTKDFFDDIAQTITNRMESGTDCQSLTTLLQSNLFSRNNSDLERENAHFKISETIISVIEHIKWTKTEKEKEITEQPNPIPINNPNKTVIAKDKKKEKKCKLQITEAVETATSYLDNSKDSDSVCYAESASEGDYEEVIPNLNETNDHIAYAEWGANNLNTLSAEGVALSLISKFSDRQLPKVSELKWLVSEGDTPQNLLPMPDLHSSENPDDHVIPSLTRGTRDWAPPRQQIIFTEYSQTNRKQLMLKQNYRCAGCGMRVAPMYMNRFRYCSYLGKYHCTGCHRNHISTIPAKVLNRWDFTCYPVSVFTYRLLEQIWSYPLFPVPDLAPSLYKRVKSLNTIKQRRLQIRFIKDFIMTCRFADDELKLFNEFPTYLTAEPDLWSMSDFIDTKNGKLLKSLDCLIVKCEKHVFDCVLCTARGFHCELCKQANIIYPWQIKVNRCDKCGSCFHRNCWKKIQTTGDCFKCQRLIKRQQNLNTDFLRSISNT